MSEAVGKNQRTSKQEASPSKERNRNFSWSAPETNSQKKSGDWYFLLWTATLAGATTAIILGNILFGLLLVIAAFTVSIYASRKPKLVSFSVSRKGVAADSLLLPFSSLSHFAIAEDFEPTYLLLQSKKVLTPLYSFPISEEVDIDELREFLAIFIEEAELEVPFYQQLMDRIGF